MKANASDQQIADIDSAVHRLTDPRPDGMGAMFKALALANPALGALPGFEPEGLMP